MPQYYQHTLLVSKRGDLNSPLLCVLNFNSTNESDEKLTNAERRWIDLGYESEKMIMPIDFNPVTKCGHDDWMKRVDWKKTVDIIPDRGDNDSVIQKFMKTNTSNKANMARNTKTYNVNGKDQSLKELAKSSGINIATLRARVARGIKGDALVEASVRGGSSRARTFDIPHADGSIKSMTLKEIAKMAGPNVPVATIRARVARGLTGMNLITGNNPANANRGKTYEVSHAGTTYELTINQIAEKFDISPATVRARAKKNFSPVEMVHGKAKKATPKSSKTKVQKTTEAPKPTMTAEDLISGLEAERNEFMKQKEELKASIERSEMIEEAA